ncbi:hypothetical protein [Szabonella alba]|uniref:Uncharacterized protein n=1 Tax=Szabonella alba TaxID=2804194 RepID=A0A8K0VEX0_9RHOB|nr:hypothetical protein [Szabonella alba]MBL4917800.1 hypothetical protein [Szabonella alba]
MRAVLSFPVLLRPALAAGLAGALSLLALGARAETPEFSLYLSLWPVGGPEDEPVAGQAADTGVDGLTLYASGPDGPVLDLTAPLSDATLGALRAAVGALAAQVSTQDQTEVPRPSISVEWMISGVNSYTRGTAVLPANALPPEVIRAQEVLFGGALLP